MTRAVSLLGAAALILAGCSSPSSEPPTERGTGATNTTSPGNGTAPGTAPAPPGTVSNATLTDVQLQDFKFVPDNFTVEEGGNLRFRNVGDHLHNVQAVYENETISSFDEDVEWGEEAGLGNLRGGSYKIRCKYHSTDFENGMVARMFVHGPPVAGPTE